MRTYRDEYINNRRLCSITRTYRDEYINNRRLRSITQTYRDEYVIQKFFVWLRGHIAMTTYGGLCFIMWTHRDEYIDQFSTTTLCVISYPKASKDVKMNTTITFHARQKAKYHQRTKPTTPEIATAFPWRSNPSENIFLAPQDSSLCDLNVGHSLPHNRVDQISIYRHHWFHLLARFCADCMNTQPVGVERGRK